MTSAPLVSVVIPAYNAAWCVGKAVDSVLAQDFRDFEVIVVNDGSTDDTAAVLAGYGDAIRVVHQANGGMSSARNAGIRAARGELIAFLDSDDWWLSGKLRRQVELMQMNPDVGFSSTAARIEDSQRQLIDIWECGEWDRSFLVHLFGNNAGIAGGSSALMVRRGPLDVLGGYDESLDGVEDADLWIRLAAILDYACIAEPLVVIRKHSASVSHNLDVMQQSVARVMRKNRHLLPPNLQGGYWRGTLAGIYGDYAKRRYRAGRRGAALVDVVRILMLAPIARGRLGLGLLRDILLGRPV
jgi:glycosyltransferase involved in cell wall biosynthesis